MNINTIFETWQLWWLLGSYSAMLYAITRERIKNKNKLHNFSEEDGIILLFSFILAPMFWSVILGSFLEEKVIKKIPPFKRWLRTKLETWRKRRAIKKKLKKYTKPASDASLDYIHLLLGDRARCGVGRKGYYKSSNIIDVTCPLCISLNKKGNGNGRA